MVNKPIILIPIIVLLIALSGCIHLLTTAERQACLSATSFSTNSVADCQTQNECYNKLTKETTISNKLPINIYNNNLIYFNNIASATYNFNKSKSSLEKLNDSCDSDNVNKIIDSANDLFLYLRNIFGFIDKSNETSIILLKDYAIYLESQGIDYIPEEKLYSDYILINENLNELKVSSNNQNYIKELLNKSEELNLVAKDFGFNKNYVSNVNYVDLTAYYLKLIEDPSGNLKVPTFAPGLNYVISELSNIEQLKNITKNLQRADSYNFYQLLDKSIGQNNSLYSEFKQINGNANSNLDEIYTKIEQLETKIETDKNYLSISNKNKYNQLQIEFINKKIGFGYYLYNLKQIDVGIENNKVVETNTNTEITLAIQKCNALVINAKEYNNNYINDLIKRYEITNNYLDKQKYCDKINSEINTSTCKQDLAAVLQIKENTLTTFSLINPTNITEEECINIINQINQVLENNGNIKLIKVFLEDNTQIISELDLQSELLGYEDKIVLETKIVEINKLSDYSNYKLIININEKIESQRKANEDLLQICKTVEENYIAENYDIKLVNNEYYLIVNNLFTRRLTDIKIDVPGISNLGIVDIYPGQNYLLITYENKQEISTRIIKLGLHNTLFGTTITNTARNIKNKIYLGKNITIVSGAELDNNGFGWYFSEYENKILYYQDILDTATKNTQLIDIGGGRYKQVQEINIKNNYEKEINGKLELKEINYNEISQVKENKKDVDTQIINGWIVIILNLKPNDEKTYEIQSLNEKEELIQLAKENIINTNNLLNSRFLDISKLAELKLNEFKDIKILESITLIELTNILQITPILKQIKDAENNNVIAEDAFFIIYNTLTIDPDVNQNMKEEIKQINQEKYTNIKESLIEIERIKELIDIDEGSYAQNTINLDYNKIQLLKEKIYKYDLEGTGLNQELSKLELPTNSNQISIIEGKLNIEIKNKAKNINLIITAIEQNNIEDIEKDIEKGRWIFQDFDLQELYSINYFPDITIPDIDRLDKKYKFLDNVGLNEEINEFKTNYKANRYEEAINAISKNTITRIEDILNEQNIIENGIIKLQEDAKNKLNKYTEENKNTKSLAVKENIGLAEDYYAKEKYLNTITVIDSKLKSQQNVKNNQIIIIGAIILILIFIGAYFGTGKKKNKELDIKERKMHVIRHN